ncbi:hypothetical protein Glove_225g32 [Diversispora epigaea]|uniref:Uncharacterized protein n=1 Tax=Diversispora epigaea TaxID=1348612 RepID=A0A397INT0_9GLOM|nr:hypothetical protein Glove_225g32 [Diversispora epigaea]
MSQIHTLSDIDEGNKLGNFPSNRYPPSRTELENHLSQANQDYKTAIDYGNQIADYNKLLLDKCSSQVKIESIFIIIDIKLRMSQIHTLSDIDEGNKLGNFPSNRYPPSRTELENHLSQANQDYKTAIDYGNQIADYNKLLLDKCSSQVKSFNREKKTWDLEKKDLNQELTQYYNEIDKLQKENTNLISQITEKELSLSKLKSKLKKKSEKKDEEICSLNSKLSELEHMKNELIEKNDKLEHQKSDILTDSNRTIFLRQFLRKNNKQNPDSLGHIKSPEQQDFTFQNDVSQRDIPYISGGMTELVPVAKSRVSDSGHIESMSYRRDFYMVYNKTRMGNNKEK